MVITVGYYPPSAAHCPRAKLEYSSNKSDKKAGLKRKKYILKGGEIVTENFKRFFEEEEESGFQFFKVRRRSLRTAAY